MLIDKAFNFCLLFHQPRSTQPTTRPFKHGRDPPQRECGASKVRGGSTGEGDESSDAGKGSDDVAVGPGAGTGGSGSAVVSAGTSGGEDIGSSLRGIDRRKLAPSRSVGLLGDISHGRDNRSPTFELGELLADRAANDKGSEVELA